jgi:hypothetical protein
VKADPLSIQIEVAHGRCDVLPGHLKTGTIADDTTDDLNVTPRDAEAPIWT